MAFRDLHTIAEMFERLGSALDRRDPLSFSSKPHQRTFVRVDWRRLDNERQAREPRDMDRVRRKNRDRMREQYDADARHERYAALVADPKAHAEHLARRRARESNLDGGKRAARRARDRARNATPEGKAARAAADARHYQRKRAGQ